MDTFARLTWAELPGATGYLVYRDGAEQPLDVTPVNGFTYDDIGLTNGRSYAYAVAALGADGSELARTAVVNAVPHSH